MFFIGIDPGKSGATVLIDHELKFLEYQMFSNWANMRCWLESRDLACRKDLKIGLEKVVAYGGNVHSSTVLVENRGGWIATLDSLYMPYIDVNVQSWQPKILGKFPKGKSKQAAMDFIAEKYPDLAQQFTNKQKFSGVADATCIALYVQKFC